MKGADKDLEVKKVSKADRVIPPIVGAIKIDVAEGKVWPNNTNPGEKT